MANRDAEPIRDKNVVAVIAFRETDIYPSDATPGERPIRVAAPNPRTRFHKVRPRAGNPSRTYEDDSPEYWKEITDVLGPAGAILVFCHGTGRANASHNWLSSIERHHPDVAARLAADVPLDIDHLIEQQVLRLAQIYFGEPPNRENGARRNNHHADTVEKILRHPAGGNVEWREVTSLLHAIATVKREHNGKLRVTLGAETEVLHPPRGKDVDIQILVDLRRMLKHTGFAPGQEEMTEQEHLQRESGDTATQPAGYGRTPRWRNQGVGATYDLIAHPDDRLPSRRASPSAANTADSAGWPN